VADEPSSEEVLQTQPLWLKWRTGEPWKSEVFSMNPRNTAPANAATAFSPRRYFANQYVSIHYFVLPFAVVTPSKFLLVASEFLAGETPAADFFFLCDTSHGWGDSDLSGTPSSRIFRLFFTVGNAS
jgi:hypothetical protein